MPLICTFTSALKLRHTRKGKISSEERKECKTTAFVHLVYFFKLIEHLFVGPGHTSVSSVYFHY